MAYKKILLKLSGESLAPAVGVSGIDDAALTHYAQEIKAILQEDIHLAIVVGGGNIYRGDNQDKTGIEKGQGDYMGMLATIINCMALQAKLETYDIPTRLMTAIKMDKVAEDFIRRRALRHWEKGRVVLLGGGTGNPFFSTDTAAALRAIELNTDIILKGTRVDGVYTADPEKDSTAVKFPELSFQECIEKNYAIMDMTAFSLCKQHNMPIMVFNINKPGTLKNVINGKLGVGTLIH